MANNARNKLTIALNQWSTYCACYEKRQPILLQYFSHASFDYARKHVRFPKLCSYFRDWSMHSFN